MQGCVRSLKSISRLFILGALVVVVLGCSSTEQERAPETENPQRPYGSGALGPCPSAVEDRGRPGMGRYRHALAGFGLYARERRESPVDRDDDPGHETRGGRDEPDESTQQILGHSEASHGSVIDDRLPACA